MENTVSVDPPRLVACGHDAHAPAILAIFNDAILHSTALYDYQPRTPAHMRAWIDAARARQLHVMVGVIDAANAASIALHQRLGFVHAGTVRQAGFKFGRWLDAAFYQLTLDTPAQPVDG